MAEALAPGSITDVPGIRVGHATDALALTGCTVILCGTGMIAGVAVRGLAPGTRETALLRPGTLVEQANALLLTGGSAFGLAAADGVMRWLAERALGYDSGGVRVPIVPAAVLFDLGLGDGAVRPDGAMGYRACEAAANGPVQQGNVGAGTGATVGKLLGMEQATKSGLGTSSVHAGEIVVGALVAVNALGDVLDPTTGQIVAGTRRPDGRGFADSRALMRALLAPAASSPANTVIGAVATNARLDVAQANEVAAAAHDGLARAVRPAHTLFDGDTLFAVASGEVPAHQTLVMDMAAEAVERAILNAVRAARSAGGLPAAEDLA